jgi:probable HAF family extracellular repeat protein
LTKKAIAAVAAALLASCAESPAGPLLMDAPAMGVTVTGATTVALGALTGDPSSATGVNDAGEIVGWSDVNDAGERAFHTDGSTVTEMTGLSGVRTFAHAINEVGQAVGKTRPLGSPYLGFFWDGAMVPLGTLGSGQTTAHGLNDLVSVQVVGGSEIAPGVQHAFVWTAVGGMVDIHQGPAGCSVAFDVNNTGTVVGTNGGAFVWTQSTGMQPLPALVPGGYAVAFGINEAGRIVGVSETANGDRHAAVWIDGVPTDLGTLGHPHSAAYAVNEAGQIVGVSSDVAVRVCEAPVLVPDPVTYKAVLWDGAAIIDLNGPDVRANSQALDINEAGDVVGITGSLPTHWTIETTPPTPEEATDDIVSDVVELVEAGALSSGRGNALLSQLEAITRQLNQGRTATAARLLESFITQVTAMIQSGEITADEGNALIAMAEAALDLIGT